MHETLRKILNFFFRESGTQQFKHICLEDAVYINSHYFVINDDDDDKEE